MFSAYNVTNDGVYVVELSTLKKRVLTFNEVREKLLRGEQIERLYVPRGILSARTGSQLVLSRDSILEYNGLYCMRYMSDAPIYLQQYEQLPIEAHEKMNDLRYTSDDLVVVCNKDSADIWNDGIRYSFNTLSMKAVYRDGDSVYVVTNKLILSKAYKLRYCDCLDKHECTRVDFLKNILCT